LHFVSTNSALVTWVVISLSAWLPYMHATLCHIVGKEFANTVIIVVVRWDSVSVEVWPLMGPLSVSHMVHEWIWSSGGMILMGKPKNSEINLSWCHFVHNKSHWTDLGMNQGPCGEKLLTNHLSCGTATLQILRWIIHRGNHLKQFACIQFHGDSFLLFNVQEKLLWISLYHVIRQGQGHEIVHGRIFWGKIITLNKIVVVMWRE
jgi:hypothetical protein